MAGRPKQSIADLKAIKKVFKKANGILDPRPLIVFVMRNCGCTFQEIADAFDTTRQNIESIYNKVEKELGK